MLKVSVVYKLQLIFRKPNRYNNLDLQANCAWNVNMVLLHFSLVLIFVKTPARLKGN